MLDLYELIKSAVTAGISKDELFEKLKEDTDMDLVADILVQLDLETGVINKEHRESYLNIVRALIRENILPTSIALERFEIETSAAVGIISDKKQFMVSYNRLRTKLYFKQKKFNLLREENEGFARVITQLSLLNSTNVNEVLVSVIEIIGKYRVDPNRILDLFLEVFEHCSTTEYDFYIDFLKLFYNNSQKIQQLIELKLSFYSGGEKNDEIPNANIVPYSFNRLLAILITKEVIDFEEIYPHLTPNDGVILKHHKELVEEAKLYARKYKMIVVGEEKPVTKLVVPETLQEEDPIIRETGNQKINLCAHLVDIGAWENALYLAKKLPEFYCFSHKRVSSSICDLINYLIDPIYRECALPKPLASRIKPVSFRSWAPPQLTSVDDAPKLLFPILSAIGPFLSTDTLVLTKVIRLLKNFLTIKQGNQEVIIPEGILFYQILDVINECILPAVALTGSNCCLSRELWSLLKNFKYQIRYKLYYNWRDESSNPVMLKNRGHHLLKAKHHMKRLSKETLRFTARHIGKMCYSNPVIILDYIVIQVQSYDNLIGIVVDALRFLPAIAIDSLLYCIIETLSANRNRKAYDGVAFAPWLTALSAFAAQIILRYKVEFTGFLEYIGFQLKSGNSAVLILLTDLIQKMTGIETITAITDDRIEALMGGDVLRTEGAYFNQVKNTRKPSARLKEALIESRLAVPLCILIAQLRDGFFFSQLEKDGTPLKLIGKLYDQCQETLVQYGMFLSMNLSIDDYINFLPSLDKLMTEYKLDTDSVFFLARPMIFHKIKSKFLALKQEATQSMMVEEGESPELSKQDLGSKFIEAAKSVIDPIAVAIQPSLNEKYGSYNGSKLFVIFWTLSMSDIEVPGTCYEREIQRLKTTLSEIGRSSDDDPKRRKERERCNSLVQKLKQEQNDQAEHVSFIKMYLESEMDNLFSNNGNNQDVYAESKKFVQHCAFARSILTASDAIYSARFLLVLHELKVKNYPTIFCLDRLLCDLTHMMGGCTENEALHYGRFLGHVLKITGNWHSSAQVFHEQCEHFPGSIINGDNLEPITYDNYRDICYKWHYRLTRAFTVALESNNYIQIRNALNVMISIIDYYPAIRHFGKSIGMKIEDVRNSEKSSRQDLYALATAYAGRLEERKPTLIPESSFHTVSSVRKKSDSSSRPASPTYRERHSSSSSRKKARHS